MVRTGHARRKGSGPAIHGFEDAPPPRPLKLLPRDAKFKLLFRIEVKDLNGRSADGRSTYNEYTIPAKVGCPSVLARVEEFGQRAGFGVIAGDVASLAQIAVDTGQREAVEFVGAA